MKDYNTYIKEANNANEIYLILKNIINELNIEIKHCSIIKNTKSYYEYNITFKNLNILKIHIVHYVNITLENENCARLFKIKLTDLNLVEILKEKIISGLIITLITFNKKNLCYNLNITLNDTIDEIVNKLIQHNQTKDFVDAIIKNNLPNNIINRYKYLLDANNFDLI